MKNTTVAKATITALFLSMFAASAFAQQVSASAVASDVSSPYVNSEDVSAPSVDAQDVSAPYVAAMGCCSVSNPVSAPKAQAEEDNYGALSMAGLGFGLFGLVGVSKLARRKKAVKEPGL
jgi:hypothetical protein